MNEDTKEKPFLAPQPSQSDRGSILTATQSDEEMARVVSENLGDFHWPLKGPYKAAQIIIASALAAVRAEGIAERAKLEAALRKCESRAWEIAGLDGAEMDAAYNQGWTDGAERCAHAAAAIARAALEMSGVVL